MKDGAVKWLREKGMWDPPNPSEWVLICFQWYKDTFKWRKMSPLTIDELDGLIKFYPVNLDLEYFVQVIVEIDREYIKRETEHNGN